MYFSRFVVCYCKVKLSKGKTNTMRQEVPELLTISEASKTLKVHPNTLRKWDKKGILKAVRFGQRGDRRYRKEDLSKFINHQKYD